MAWDMEDNREILSLDIARIRAWMKVGKDRDAAGLAAISGCELLLGLCGEVVRLIAIVERAKVLALTAEEPQWEAGDYLADMLRGHSVDRFLVAKPGAPTPPVN